MAELLLSPDLAGRFFRGATTPAENRNVVRQVLLHDLDFTRRLTLDPEDPSALYDPVFDRLLARATTEAQTIETERQSAALLAREIEAALGQRLDSTLERQIDNEPRFHNRALAQTLRQRSFEAGLEQPERALRLARLALAVATRATRDVARLDADLLASAQAQLGNALRIVSRLHEAGEALAAASRHLDAGTGDPLARAQLLSFEASLAKDRSQLREGIARCRKAARLYRRVGDAHGEGKMLVQEADLHARRGELTSAIGCLDRALAAIDVEAEPRLGLVMLHNLTSYLDQQELYAQAAERLEQARALAEPLGRRLDLVRLRWLEGRIAGHLGQDELAETCWREAHATFVELGIPYDAALVMLELAALLVCQGRHAEVRALVEEMVSVFEAEELHGEAQTALKVLGDALRARTAGLELIRQVGERLEKARGSSDPLSL